MARLVNDADHFAGSLLASFDAELSQFGRKKDAVCSVGSLAPDNPGEILRLADAMERCAENGSMQKNASVEVS